MASFFPAPSMTVVLYLGDAAVALVDDSGPEVRLLTLAVDPAQRGRGLGRQLLRAIAVRLAPRAVTVIAVVPEIRATPLFAGAGWTRTAIGQVEMECRHIP